MGATRFYCATRGRRNICKSLFALFLSVMIVTSQFGIFFPLHHANANPVTGNQITYNILTSATVTDANGDPWSDTNRPGLDSPANISLTWALPDQATSGLYVEDGDYFSFDLPDQFAIYTQINGDLMVDGVLIGTYSIVPDSTYVGHVTMTFNEQAALRSNVAGTLSVNTRFNEETITGSTVQEIVFPVETGFSIFVHFSPTGTMTALEKSGVSDKQVNSTYIDWTVDINKKENTLTNATLSDDIPTGLSIRAASIHVYNLTVNIDGTVSLGSEVPATDYTLGAGDDLSVTFDNPITGAYRIKYTTDIIDTTITTFTNAATLSATGYTPVNVAVSIANTRGPNLVKASSYNSATQTITWTINYNGDESVIAGGTVLHDLFTNTHGILGDVSVYQAAVSGTGTFTQGALVSSDSGIYSITPTSNTSQNGFDLTFGAGAGRGAYQIVYKTQANGLVTGAGSIVNRVTENTGPSTTSRTQSVSQVNIVKTSTSTNYSTKTISWRIAVNGNHYQMNNAVIADTFDNLGLALKAGTFAITATSADGTTYSNKPLINGSDYSLVNAPDGSGFVITLLGAYAATTDNFVITYTTDFNYANLISGMTRFSNTSRISWIDPTRGPQSSSSTATVNPNDATKFNGFKTGSYNLSTKEITWGIGINYNYKTISEPIVVDPIQGNQQYVAGSLVVYPMTIASNGSYAMGTALTEGSTSDGGAYTVDYPSSANSNTLTVHFNSSSSTPYYVSFKTSLVGQVVNQSYPNTASVYDGETPDTSLSFSVSPTNGGSLATKTGLQSGNSINWTVNINPSQSTITNAVLTDTPTANQIIDVDTFHLYPATVNSNSTLTPDIAHELVSGIDYVLAVTTVAATGQQSFTITFPNTIVRAYVLTYSSLINAANGATVGNTGVLTGSNVLTLRQETTNNVIVRTSSGSGSSSGVMGGFTMTKVDSVTQAPLAGAVFALIDSGKNYDTSGTRVLYTLTTGTDGKLVFGNLRYGSYTLKEITAPADYALGLANQNGIAVTVNQSMGALTVANTLKTGGVVLTKRDALSTELLAGAVFDLTDSAGSVLQQGLTTLDTGCITLVDLAPGDYCFVETQAPFGYDLDATPIPFTIERNQVEQLQVTATDTLTPGDIVLLKKDSVSDELLSGAVFNLTDSADEVLQQGLTSDGDGSVTVENLAPGDYCFVETQAPFGYDLDATPIPFTIAKGQSEPLQIAMTNTLTPGGVVLTKADSVSGEGLPDAVFNLEDSTGNVLQQDLTTDQNGCVDVENLIPGDYRFVEMQAPFGYELDSTPIPFTIEKGQAEPLQLTMTNTLIPGDVVLTKKDSAGTKVLSGAVFELQDSAGKVLKQGLVTNGNGCIIVDDLAPGDYQFVEKQAPTGYSIDATPVKFTIEKGQIDPVQITMKNTLTIVAPMGNEFSIPATGDKLDILIPIALFIAALAMFVAVRKNKKSIR